MSNLILGRGPCPRPTVEIAMPIYRPRFSGIYYWKLTRSGIILQEGMMKNLITNAGLDGMGVSSLITLTDYCAVGTSSTTPDTSQTALGAEVERTTNTTTDDLTVTSGPSFAYWSRQRVHVFTEAHGNGNLTEVGYFNQATPSGSTMFSRQLFKDNLGSPVTVVKTSSDQLQITYEFRVETPASDSVQSAVTISGVDYDITSRGREIDSSACWGTGMLAGPNSTINTSFQCAIAYETDTLGVNTSSPAGSGTLSSSTSKAAYSNGNYYLDMTYTWEPSAGNFTTGIGSIIDYGNQNAGSFAYQTSFSPKLAKDATKRLTLVSRCGWARV